ncbi:recombinase family protein [Streptantibioticus parmotrematis]|uniref:recombinase family protein n=1 Tax=Streptantibioticus parmotrematis TaxID=2873249 RepID=UPI00340A6853
MATTGYSSPTDAPDRHGPIPTMVYVCEPDAVTAGRRAEICRTHAAHRTWWVVDTVIEEQAGLPLEERPGWQRVRTALARGAVGIVITWDPATVAAGLEDFQALQASFRSHGAVLVAATGTPDAPPPRHDTQA